MKHFCILILAIVFGLIGCSKGKMGAMPPSEDGMVRGGPAPAVGPVVVAGAQTKADLAAGKAAAWTARFRTKDGKIGVDVDVVRQGKTTSWTYRNGNQRTNGWLLRIVETNGVWLVRDGQKVSRWRPYEARLGLLMAHSYLAASGPVPVTGGLFENLQYAARKDEMLEYRTVIPKEQEPALKSLVQEMEDLIPQLEGEQRRSTEASLRDLKRKAEQGDAVLVDESLGILLSRPFLMGLVEIWNFKWLDATSPKFRWLDIGGPVAEGDDHTRPITDWDLHECVLIDHDPTKMPTEERQPVQDVYILNLKSGDLRRVPYRGVSGFRACFLKDRRWVAIGSMAAESPAIVKVNLETGENEFIGEGQIRPGRLGFLTELSPDGKRLGFVETAWESSMLHRQMRWMDLETGVASNIGKPLEMFAGFSWLPDGNGVVLTRALPVKSMKEVSPRMLSIMSLKGSLKDLGKGDLGMVLRTSGRILYQSKEQPYLWMTMDLQGGDLKPFGKGFAEDHAFPAISPDETRIFFEKRGRPLELQPHVFEMGGGAGKRVSEEAGFFGQAWWR